MGEQGASLDYVKPHPENMVCPFCNGQAAYSTEEEPDNRLMYRQPLEYEPPNGKNLLRRIISQRLHRPRRCLPHRLKRNKKLMNRIFKILNG